MKLEDNTNEWQIHICDVSRTWLNLGLILPSKPTLSGISQNTGLSLPSKSPRVLPITCLLILEGIIGHKWTVLFVEVIKPDIETCIQVQSELGWFFGASSLSIHHLTLTRFNYEVDISSQGLGSGTSIWMPS